MELKQVTQEINLLDDNDSELTGEQQESVYLCADEDVRIASVTGEAGTGKTYVLGRAYREMIKSFGTVALCAPTGRAAKRIQELTGIQAMTIHRLLKFPMPDDPDDEDAAPGVPRHNSDNPLPFGGVIVDEASMLGPSLFGQLMDACRSGTVVRLFGDMNQLPPVEEGKAPFLEMLAKRPSVKLTYNFRNEDEILGNAQRILRGRMPIQNERFRIVYTNDPVRYAVTHIDDRIFAGPEAQIITPQRKGNNGTIRINPTMQLKFQPDGEFLNLDRLRDEDPQLTVRKGDKYIWIKNDYQLDLMNGDIGEIIDVDSTLGYLRVLSDGREILVPPEMKVYSQWHHSIIRYDPRKQLELGYAITTHKSQGGEFDEVVYVMSARSPYMLNRNNFYTGVTRARRRVTVITDQRGMRYSLRPPRNN